MLYFAVFAKHLTRIPQYASLKKSAGVRPKSKRYHRSEKILGGSALEMELGSGGPWETARSMSAVKRPSNTPAAFLYPAFYNNFRNIFNIDKVIGHLFQFAGGAAPKGRDLYLLTQTPFQIFHERYKIAIAGY